MSSRSRIIMMLALVLACGDDGSPGTSAAGSTTATSDTSGSLTTPTTGISESQSGDTSSSTDAESGATNASTSEATTSGSTEPTSNGETSSGTTGPSECRLVLAEVLYDSTNMVDDMLQWVKLYNPCDETFDLTMYSLGYGGSDYTTTLQLDLSVPAGGCFVVGGPTADASNGDPNYGQFADFDPDLDRAMGVGGGIALFDIPAAAVDGDSVPIDAVVYGPNNDNGLVDASGTPVATPHVGNPPAGGSIRRNDFGPNWETADMPTPSECPPF